MMKFWWWCARIVVAGIVGLALFMGVKALHLGHSEAAGKAAPDLAGGVAWINSPPLTIAQLKGKVVLVDFWEYTCVNCLRTLPYLKEWQRRYKDDGLVIIGVHTPEFAFAAEPDNVKRAAKDLGIEYPVAVDSNYRIWKAYDNHYWPHHFLIDRRGVIREDHVGEGGYGLTELRIQQLLRDGEPNAVFPAVMTAVRPEDKPGAVCYPTTGETYVGYGRGELGNSGGYTQDRPAAYQDPGTHLDGVIYAQGEWIANPESMRHGRSDPSIADYLALRYHATEVNAVMKSAAATPYRVYLTQDGKPLDPQDAGKNVKFDEGARSYVEVGASRMYYLVHNRKHGGHDLRLSSPSEDFDLYAFTFGSCEVPNVLSNH